MIRIGGRPVLVGGFHDHWVRADDANPALLFASLNYYHYDFCCLMDGAAACAHWRAAAAAYSSQLTIYPGQERSYDWGHVVTIGPDGSPAPPSYDTDYRRVLSDLRAHSELVFLAHPAHALTWDRIFCAGLLDELVDGGYLDGVELTIELRTANATRNAALIDWYRSRNQAGRRTPLVGGWDVHMTVPAGPLPRVLYTARRPPDGHFETLCSSRTLVFAEENSLAAIKAAVLAEETVLEDLSDGRLVGRPDLVRFLNEHGYREAMSELDRRRDRVELDVDAWVMSNPGQLRVSEPGAIRLPRTFSTSWRRNATTSAIGIPHVPTVRDRDTDYLPVTWQSPDGFERMWAVQADHPIRLDILPRVGAGEAAVEVVAHSPFRGDIHLSANDLGLDTDLDLDGGACLPLPPGALPERPVAYELTATAQSGVSRRYEGHLTFIGASYFTGDWTAIPAIGVDRAEFVPKVAYGLSRPWPGPDVFSGRIQFAWDEQAFRMRVRVRDAIHHQPFIGHHTYQADCLQLAVDPLLRRAMTIGSVYVFNLALTSQGPELFRMWSPTAEATDEFTPPKENASLGDRYLSVEQTDGGLIYTMALGWTELGPADPHAGMRMGIYFVMKNNDGEGGLDVLHWPVPIFGMWQVPLRWGVLTLLERPQPS
jgi:hypothetical protein